ncbi:acetate--CoA ligase family protein [Candidatus Bipolaricaulota bacterium]|nr:acetate--CoA ligase family protein [Candidatus Bipolaricaulota bacterium]
MNCECCSEEHTDTADEMRSLFQPRTIAVFGASTNPAKVGYRVVENLLKGGYQGTIYPINPNGGEILGCPVWRSVGEISDDIDVAVMAIPARLVFDAVVECGNKGVKHLVVITSGFSEVGNIEEEERIVAYAREHGMRVLGPNVFGVYSDACSMNATFGPSGILSGHVAIVTQSGALGIAMIGKTAAEALGLSAVVSVGNKADVDESDLLEYLGRDDNTRVILLYIEGVKHGDRLARALRWVTQRKHVVVIKSGRSKRGAMAAASHTGSLAGADDVFDAVMKQSGALRAESVQDAFNWVQYLATAPAPIGKDAVIITNGGGIGVMATDACEKFDIALFDDQKVLKEAFSDVMPDFGSSKNPVDLTGQANAQDYEKALDAALNEENIHSVMALYCETALFDTEEFGRLIRKTYAQFKERKPILFTLFGGAKIEALVRELRMDAIPVFANVYEAVSCLGVLYRSWRNHQHARPAPASMSLPIERITEILRTAGKQQRGFLLAHEAAAVSAALGFRMPQSMVAANLDEAVQAAENIGYPVVLKIVSKDIIHKSDAGGVALDLQTREEVIDAYQAILRACRVYKRDAKIEGMEVAEMVRAGVETIIGARQDRSFGPTVMVGLGGIYVEVLKDVAFRAAPVDRATALEMIADLRSFPLLLGVRGEKRKDIEAVADVIVTLSHLIDQCRELTDIEINPLVAYDVGEGAKAVDVRILFQTPEEVR